MAERSRPVSSDAIRTMRTLRGETTGTSDSGSSDDANSNSNSSPAGLWSRAVSVASVRRNKRRALAHRASITSKAEGDDTIEEDDYDDDDDRTVIVAPGQQDIKSVDDWPQPISYRAALLQQMLGRFLHVYFPNAATQTEVDLQNDSYLFLLPTIDLATYPLLNHAASVLCYAHFGLANKDFRLQLESRRHYASAVALLRREVSRKTPVMQPWIVIISILLLAMYDDAVAATSSSPVIAATDWMTHYEGALAYIEAVGPAHFGMSVSKAYSLASNLISPDLYLAMANRKASIFANPRWRQVVGGGPHQGFALLSFNTPQILQRVEQALRHPSTAALTAVCEELTKYQADLQEWYPKDLPMSNLASLFEMYGFDPTVEEHVFLATNSTFEPYFGDTSPDAVPLKAMMAFVKARPWIHSIMVCCAMLRIYHYHPELACRDGEDARPGIHRQTYELAANMCRMMWALAHTNVSQPVSQAADLMINLAEHYFEEIQATQELGWCQGARLAIDLHLRRLQTTQLPTLCRLGDINAALASLTSFRAPIRPVGTKNPKRRSTRPQDNIIMTGTSLQSCPHVHSF